MGRTNTKKMVQGAMIAAIFGALSLINTYTGSIFDIFICYGMVVPIVWYGYQYTLKDNIIVCIVAMFIIAMMGLPFFVISSISSCLAGLYIGEALKRKAKKETILLGTLVVMFLNNILIYEVFSGLLGVNLVEEMTETYNMMISMFPSMSSYMTLDLVLNMIPLFLLITSTLEMYVIVLLCQVILMRLKIDFPGSFHIAMMHLSKKTGLVLLVMVIGSLILKNILLVDSIIINYIYFIGDIFLALQGLSFLSYWLIMKRKVIFMIFVFIGLFIPFTHIAYVAIGIIDIYSDLRKKILYNSNR